MEQDILIEDKLIKLLDGGLFERFGNQYLRYYYNEAYKHTSLGTQIGKNRPVKGQPDTYFSLPGHQFIFAEFTVTNKDGLYNKLKRDIQACLAEKQHGVPLKQIAKIDLVFCGKLGPIEEIELTALCSGIPVELHNIDSLVDAVKNNARLAKDLGISIDTGQILAVDDFIDFYERNRLAIGTPLSNEFLARTELDSLRSLLETKDIVIIHGKKGNGKTKLSIECMRRHISDNPDYKGYCIIDQSPSIWEDAQTYFLNGRNYIVLIDDANRQTDNLITILSRIRQLSRSIVKILITVRNYAHDEVRSALRSRGYRFEELSVGLMSQDQIISVLKSPSFAITSTPVLHRITQLAKDDARFAVMLATMHQDGEDILVMSDISHAYDAYYAIVLPNATIWQDDTCLRVMGLTAVLRAVDLTRDGELPRLLAFLNITAEKLWEWVRYLEKLEIIEVYEDNAFRFSDQVFATYAFYRSLIERRVIILETLLVAFHESDGYRIKDSIFSLFESYVKKQVVELVPSVLANFYKTLTNDKGRLAYLTMYSRFLPDEAFAFIHGYVQGTITFEPRGYFEKEINKKVADILFSRLIACNTKTDSILGYELMIGLVGKQAVPFDDIKAKLQSYLRHEHEQFDNEEQGSRFEQYNWLSAYLSKRGLQGSATHCTVFDSLLKSFLVMFYGNSENERTTYRDQIWEYVMYRAQTAPDTVKDILYDYMIVDFSSLAEEELYEDISRVSAFVRQYFSPEDALDCHFVHKYVNGLNKIQLTQRPYRSLVQEFNGELYQLYCLLSFEHISRRERLEVDISGSPTLRARKVQELHQAIQINSIEDFRLFYGKVLRMWQSVLRNKDGWQLSEGLTEVMLQLANQDASLFLLALPHMVEEGLPESYMDRPPLLPTVLERGQIDVDALYNILLPLTEKSAGWLLSLFWSLPESVINAKWVDRLNGHLPLLARYRPVQMSIVDRLKRYVRLDSQLPTRLLQLWQVNKNQGYQDLVLYEDFFEEFSSLMDNSVTTLLEQYYLNQYFKQRAFDHDRKALALLLDRRVGFWMDFMAAHYEEGQYGHADFGQLSFVWHRADYYKLITEALSFIEKRKVYTLHKNDVEAFFEHISAEVEDNVDEFYVSFLADHSTNISLIDAIYEALLANRRQDVKRFFQLFMTYNKSIEDFARIDWISRGGWYSGGVIISDIRAGEWGKVLTYIDDMEDPLTYMPHRLLIKEFINDEQKRAAWERRDNFFRRTY
jgi:hypothetical protein